MARSTKVVVPQRARKAIALVRAFPEVGSPAKERVASPAPVAASARVRDGLVLRLVGKKKSIARSVPDERRTC